LGPLRIVTKLKKNFQKFFDPSPKKCYTLSPRFWPGSLGYWSPIIGITRKTLKLEIGKRVTCPRYSLNIPNMLYKFSPTSRIVSSSVEYLKAVKIFFGFLGILKVNEKEKNFKGIKS
jgi:hypothetical protein